MKEFGSQGASLWDANIASYCQLNLHLIVKNKTKIKRTHSFEVAWCLLDECDVYPLLLSLPLLTSLKNSGYL